MLEAELSHSRFGEIVEESRLPKSTVHRILGMLIQSGYIEGDADQGFHPGRRFTSLAGRTLTDLNIVALARPIVTDLVAATGCTVHIGEERGEEVELVLGFEPTKPYRVRARTGTTTALHTTGLGKALLAQRSADEVRGYAERTGLPARTPATVTELGPLLEELDSVARSGYALDLEGHEVGTVCVSAPIYNHLGVPAYSLSISSLVLTHPENSIERFAPRAVAAAAELSELLGARL